jgi:arginyl-tRNA synthetase
MRYTEIQESLRTRIAELSKELFGIAPEAIVCEFPPKVEMGDLAFPIGFELAKSIKAMTGEKKNPREIAEKLRVELSGFENVERIEIAGAGYLNVFLDRTRFLLGAFNQTSPSTGEKRTVEHTSVNPNKAAHIGHVRNSVLGDTMARILAENGHSTEVQNYIDNTGVQVADVVVGFIALEKLDLDQIKELDSKLGKQGVSFDYYCWDLYTKVGKAYESDDELKALRLKVLHDVEEGGNPIAELADYVASRNVECIVRTMDRLGIRYDLLPRESEILHLKFWHHAFEKMKELNVIRYESEGKNAGCWVMPFDSHEGSDEHDADKILVRSNGTVTYTGKDIAYQLWKLGELDMDFGYREFMKYPDGKPLWITTDHASGTTEHPTFGGGNVVYNVIDSRQSYTQEVVRRGVSLIAPERGEDASVHLAYEMVALSPKAAAELGFTLSEEDKTRSFVEMSGRKGLGVKADDLIDRLEQKAFDEVEKRHAEADEVEKRLIARQIAIGALRYFLLKFTRNTVVVFDFEEALSFEGETGVYCQYSAVRNNSIFKKIDSSSIADSIDLLSQNTEKANEILVNNNEVWSVLSLAGRFEETVKNAERQLEPAILAKYVFSLCKAFNLFYHNHKILAEADPIKKAVLLLTAERVGTSLTRALDVLGISVPERM